MSALRILTLSFALLAVAVATPAAAQSGDPTLRDSFVIGDVLWATRTQLMAEANTSHPYSWSGFAIVGDGTQPLVVGAAVAIALSAEAASGAAF